MKEIWKDIENYEGLYQISNLGNVRRMRFINYTTDKFQIKELKPSDNGSGYKIVGLCKNGKRTNHYIHRLVCQMFNPNPHNFDEVNHIDHNKNNNIFTNLEFCSRSYNVKYSFDQGIRKAKKNMLGKKGKNHPISKPVVMKTLDNKIIKKYESAHLASLDTGVCYSSIKNCRSGKQKTAGGYKWALE